VRTDWQETDVDCGKFCTLCALGQHCNLGWDCTTNTCVNHLCHVPLCIDGEKDGNETDVDCGGGSCPPCGLGQNCQLEYDCTTHACDALSHLCIADHCLDHAMDGNETDIDCGGPECTARCPEGSWCQMNSDCAAGLHCSAPYPQICEH
jgi:hypothetical protein